MELILMAASYGLITPYGDMNVVQTCMITSGIVFFLIIKGAPEGCISGIAAKQDLLN